MRKAKTRKEPPVKEYKEEPPAIGK